MAGNEMKSAKAERSAGEGAQGISPAVLLEIERRSRVVSLLENAGLVVKLDRKTTKFVAEICWKRSQKPERLQAALREAAMQAHNGTILSDRTDDTVWTDAISEI